MMIRPIGFVIIYFVRLEIIIFTSFQVLFRVDNLLFMSDQSYSFNLPIAELIEQLSRSAYGESFTEGLKPAQ